MSIEQSFDDGSIWQLERNEQDRITDEVAQISDRRAVIEQAKGMLMLLHGIGADEAFKLLQWQSQDNNVKLRELAEQVITDYQEISNDNLAARVVYDRLFGSAHSRLVVELMRDGTELADTDD